MSIEKVKALKAKYEEFLAKIKKEDLAEPFREFLEKYPFIEAVKWSQYTPYFNDGDVCTFSVNEPETIIDGEPRDCGKTEEWVVDGQEEVTDNWTYPPRPRLRDKYVKKAVAPISLAAAEDFDRLHQSFDDDIFKAVFGDHVEVTYSLANGFEIDEYEHE